jgi:hypothetical protein
MRAHSYRWLLTLLLFVATSVFAIHYPRVYLVALGGTPSIDDETSYDCGFAVCFAPNPLTIVAGDIVMFYIAPGDSLNDTLPAAGPHNVVADDGSFRCAKGCDGEGGDGTPRDWTSAWYFTRKFTDPGVVRYHDEVTGVGGEIIVMPVPDSSEATAAEYYYAAWGFYFITASQEEIAALDGGAFGGAWKRTGQNFDVWIAATNDNVPTCRFFSTAFGAKSSHFYTPYAAECASLQAGTSWELESLAFYVRLPDADGFCPSGTVVLYRLFNNGMGGAPNHRYTTSAAILDQMLAAGWSFEGNATTRAFACVPSSG